MYRKIKNLNYEVNEFGEVYRIETIRFQMGRFGKKVKTVYPRKIVKPEIVNKGRHRYRLWNGKRTVSIYKEELLREYFNINVKYKKYDLPEKTKLNEEDIKSGFWKQLTDGMEDYYISKDGRVYSFKSKTILKGWIYRDGYRRYDLKINGKKFKKAAHRLVAKAFLPNPENKEYVNHKDLDKLNNSLSNLEWVTPSENNLHARGHVNYLAPIW